VAGAAAITVLLQQLNDLGTREGMPASAPAVLSYGLFGALLMVMVLFAPRGLVPTATRLWQRRANGAR
jgi:branched-chain amino acid transport system permease protein